MTFRPIVVLLAIQLGVSPAFAQRGGGFHRGPTRERQAAPAPARQGEQGGRSQERESPSRTGQSAFHPSAAAEAAPQREREQGQRPRWNSAADGDRQSNVREGGQSGTRDSVGVQRSQGRDNVRERDSGPRVAAPRQGPPARVVRQGPPARVVQPSTRAYAYGPNVYVGIGRAPSYRYTPRFSRPYVYGSLGPGYFYYGSYGWYPRATYYYDGGYFGRGYGYDTGEVRLQVQPRFAEVYVDGYYAGTVDDFDGTFQSLRLESGPYHIEIVAPGYNTLEVDLRVSAGQKITYRGDLRPEY